MYISVIISCDCTVSRIFTCFYPAQHSFSIRQLLRCWFAKHGVNFKLNRKSKKKRPSVGGSIERKVSWNLLLTRIEWEVHQRRINTRADLLHTFQEKYVKLVCILSANIKYWIDVDRVIVPDIDRLCKDKIKFERVYMKQSKVSSFLENLFCNVPHETLYTFL